ncbi:MAG: tetratricopeptide repeat protein [Elusimicrobia bacterium]|nr:tetratricopeptide repeat protein [Elusimicrobiota bacterium]
MIKKLFNIMVRPSDALADLMNEEPVFGGSLVFALSVIAGNIGLVRNFLMDWQTLVFHGLSLIFMWGGTLVLIDMMILGFIKILEPHTSALLNKERFRKLFICQLHISVVLIARPFLDIFTGAALSWILVFIWGMILVLAAVVKLWNITEIKGAVSIALAVGIVFITVDRMSYSEKYPLKGMKKFISFLDASLEAAGDSDRAAAAAQAYAADRAGERLAPYCELIGTSIIEKQSGAEGGKATQMYARIMDSGEMTPIIYNTVMLRLSRALTLKEFVLLQERKSNKGWYRILRLWRIPANFAFFRDNILRIRIFEEIIRQEKMEDLQDKIQTIIDSCRYSDFEDDVYFMLGDRFYDEGQVKEAAGYYRMCADTYGGGERAKKRIKMESLIALVEERLGNTPILEERFRNPYALMKIAGIYGKSGELDKSLGAYREIVEKYPEHAVCSAALLELIKHYESEKEYGTAVKLCNKFLRGHPDSAFRDTVIGKRDRMRAEASGERPKKKGRARERRKKPGRSARARYEEGERLLKDKRYIDALKVFEEGYERFGNTGMGFDFAYKVAAVLSEDMHYYSESVRWYEYVRKKFRPDYMSPATGKSVADMSLEAARIYGSVLKDYEKASQAYREIIKYSPSPEKAAEAMYGMAYIEENVNKDTVSAGGLYRKIISLYPDTAWKKKAQDRLARGN